MGLLGSYPWSPTMQDILSQTIQFDEKGQSLVTKFKDGTILSEPISAEEAAQWQAEHKL